MDYGDLAAITAELMMKTYKTNTVAPLMLTQAFLPLLKKAAADKEDKSTLKAWILNMSSSFASIEMNTSNGCGGLYSYRASKTALNIVNKSLSVDLKSDGIHAVVLHPGWVQTDMGGPKAAITVKESILGLMKVTKAILFIHFFFSFFLSFFCSVHSFVRLFIYSYIYLFVRLFIHLFHYPSIHSHPTINL